MRPECRWAYLMRLRFLNDAQARLEWLEGIVRTRLPDIDLGTALRRPDEVAPSVEDVHQVATQEPANQNPGAAWSATNAAKRPLDVSLSDPSGPALKSARRMAMDLGLFSLHPNASQAHYLGSSSGSLFASLLRKDPFTQPDQDPHANDGDDASEPDIDSSGEAGTEKRAVRHQSHEIFACLQETLPSRHDCNRMIERFFAYYHPDYPVLHQPSFKSLVDALYASAKEVDTSSLQHNGWPSRISIFRYNDEVAIVGGREAIAINIGTAAAQLFFVMSIASHLQTRKRFFGPDPSKFTARAMSLFQLSLANVTVASVQSILLCVLQEFLTSEGGSMWILLHIAMSYAIDLGIHRCHPVSARSPVTAVHMRRRVFFTLYTLERLV